MIHRIMTLFLSVVFLIFLTVCEESIYSNQLPDENNHTLEGWELVWNDEFDGDAIDDQKWNKLLWRPGWVNNELQAYTDRDTNLFVQDDNLVIRALIEPGFFGTDYTGTSYTADYTSGRLNTAGKGEWTYGRFDTRAKLPKGIGSWPAIWMLGSNISTVGWPHCGEIDIMEHVGFDEGNIHASIHTTDYNHVNGTQKSGQVIIPTATDSFHVYSLEWDSTYIRYLVDDEPYFFIYNDSNGDEDKWPFNKPQYIILNLAVGGDWGGAQGIDPTVFPMEMKVDYVRVFEKSESSTNVNVTFQVDMKNEMVSGEGVWLSGGNISSGQPGGLQMQPVADTTIWEITLTLPPYSSYNYKYRNGHYPDTWSGGWESVPDECGEGSYNDRALLVGNSDTTLSVVCFNECTACD
ncbi:MAG: glycoside hydrolase family 16 protein [Candidatus Marinimicrobia bacterium]|nr:glycoside hydrolase family 16 protein [Candidatus Neomarinimicrobiota bacterium]